MVMLGNLQHRISSNYSVICYISVLGAIVRCGIAFDSDTSGPETSQMLPEIPQRWGKWDVSKMSISKFNFVKLVLLLGFDKMHFFDISLFLESQKQALNCTVCRCILVKINEPLMNFVHGSYSKLIRLVREIHWHSNWLRKDKHRRGLISRDLLQFLSIRASPLRCCAVNNAWRLSLHVCFLSSLLKCQRWVERRCEWKKTSLDHSIPFEAAMRASYPHANIPAHFPWASYIKTDSVFVLIVSQAG